VISLPSKISQIPVSAGDVLIYRTAGGGGWKDPLDRPAELVQKDVQRKLVSVHKARSDYGVVLDSKTSVIDTTATEDLRARMKKQRGPFSTFSFGSIPEPIGVVRNWLKPASRAVGPAREEEPLISSEPVGDRSFESQRKTPELDSLPAAEINSTILPL
jgi:hypothetical protein